MKNWKILALLPIMGLGACAQAPGSITPATVPNTYDRMSCADAAIERSNEARTLEVLTAAQESKRVTDGLMIVGFGLIGGAVNMMTDNGDNVTKISISKGRLLALDARLSRCRS